MEPLLGLLVVVAAGALNGTYALPLKGTTRWAWENTWLVYSAVGMVVVGWAVAWSTVPNLAAVYAGAGTAVIGMVFLFGMLWGVANFLFGLGIDMLGISLAFPLAIGLSLALGSLLTLAAKDPRVFLTGGGVATVAGVGVIVLGVIICAIAGVQRDRPATQAADSTRARRRLVLGLCVAIASGLFDPMLNFAFQFGGRIEAAAAAQGAAPLACSDAIWVWPLLGSFVVNTAYCSFLLTRNGTWRRYREPGTASHWLLAGLMGVIWMSSITLYGRGASMMGPYGKSVGWAVFYCAIILFSGLWGIVCGEWRAAARRPLFTMLAGLAVLLAAFGVLGYGNYLFQLADDNPPDNPPVTQGATR
jgi:L-rhamnose-H+ transport protein